jgi:hypothetical protein
MSKQLIQDSKTGRFSTTNWTRDGISMTPKKYASELYNRALIGCTTHLVQPIMKHKVALRAALLVCEEMQDQFHLAKIGTFYGKVQEELLKLEP